MESKFFSIRIVLGVLFLLLGVAGLFLPVLQGVLFLVVGAVFLGYPIPAKWLKKVVVKR